MKKYLSVFVILSAVVLCGASTTLAADVGGTWDAYFAWSTGAPNNSTWTITQSGASFKLVSSSGTTANGVTSGALVYFIFSGGCRPFYIGFSIADSMGGAGICTDGSGGNVSWMAKRYPESAEVPELSFEDGPTESSPETE